MKEHDKSGWDTGKIQAPKDPHHINGFLRDYGWLRVTEGKDYRKLSELVEPPSQRNPGLLPLKERMERYFGRIRGNILGGMGLLILRWVNTPEG
jgi:hypothetical protein